MTDPELMSPPPARRTWGSRLVRLGLLLVPLAIGLWWGVAVWMGRLTSGELEALAAADRLDPGWRFDELEAQRDNPPPAENGALRVLAVAKRLPADQPLTELGNLLGAQPPEARLSQPQTAALRQALADLGPALSEARRLIDYPRGRYPVQWAPNPAATALTCQDARRVASWLSYDAMLRAEDGDHAGALTNGRAIFQTSRTVGDEPSGISQLVRIALRAVGVQALERLLAQGEPPADGLAELQRWLEAEEPVPLELIVARAERASFEKGSAELFGNVSLPARLGMDLMPTVSPARTRSTGLRILNALVETAKRPEAERPANWVTAAVDAVTDDDGRELPTLVKMVVPSVEKTLSACVRSHAQMRCALVAVAAERFRRDMGLWPESADALVKAGLLKAVPADPYDRQPLRLKRQPDGLTIYAVGPDKADDGGTLNRKDPTAKGSDLGLRLWDTGARRQAPLQ
jgi:hypothetical protein